MQVCSPMDGKWYEVTGNTVAQITSEMNIERSSGWCFKVNGEVRKSLGTVNDGDIIELVDEVKDDTETMQSPQVLASSKDNE